MRFAGTILFILLGLAFARYSWHIPLAKDAERGLYDIRLNQTAQRVGQDDRIVLIVYTDETLEALGKRSPLDRKMLADALRKIDGMKPKAIGVDILIDQPQAEDPILINTLRSMRTPVWLAFASNAAHPDYMRVWQEEFLTGFLKQVAGGPVRPASISLEPDLEDGVTRSWPARRRDLPPLLATAMAPGDPAFRTYSRSIAFRLPENEDYPVFSKLPIELFTTEFADALREQVEGRYVLIGGDIQDADDYETPMTRIDGRLSKGVEVHAHLLAQLLDGKLPAKVPGWALWLVAFAVVAAGGLTSLLDVRGWKLAAVLVGQIIFFVSLPFLFQAGNTDTLGLPAFGWWVGWLFAFAAVGTAQRAVGAEERRFAQVTLGKYLPADVAAEILRDPDRLALHGEKRQIYAMFTDMEGFTRLSHAITPEQLSTLLNRYLDVLSDTVLDHGGTIDKFVGDAVVAFWGAPIARPDDADRAIRAAIAMYEAGEEFHNLTGGEFPPIGCTRVGVHRGDAVIGNFGGKGRIQYTALGDGMNTAARLESANKSLKTTILVSTEAKEQSTLDCFRPMGRIVLSGRATPVEVWEPRPLMDPGYRQRQVDLWLRFEAGDLSALAELEQLANEHKEDAALANFVYRIREAGPGGHFVLGSK
ncbi:MAG TPA: adenylate/guanylate cyclase domain-containing protein [Allosphingosinicella sp.]|nr:adenylate/guanylate cyclase domain-containing protein [Allosphingosinicella sp.]